ncbi:MAG: YfcE family phosphodiesterase [Desulfobulbus sp.]|jgi:putative phosphoesterase
MRIAVLSDSHDHIPNLCRAVSLANAEQAEVLLHCGDLISPFMLKHLGRFQGPVHLLYGNNAGDRHLIASRCGTIFTNIRHHGEYGTLTLGSLRIALHHYPDLARTVARSGEYDLVCYGHDHIFHCERIGNCTLLNPGDLLGAEATPGFVLFDSKTGSTRRIEVGEQMTIEP